VESAATNASAVVITNRVCFMAIPRVIVFVARGTRGRRECFRAAAGYARTVESQDALSGAKPIVPPAKEFLATAQTPESAPGQSLDKLLSAIATGFAAPSSLAHHLLRAHTRHPI
jgi:hypothetical protein